MARRKFGAIGAICNLRQFCTKLKQHKIYVFSKIYQKLPINWLKLGQNGCIAPKSKDFCCANQTHFVEYIGKCSEFTINYLDELKFLKLKYKTPDCPVFNNRKYASYIKHSEECVIIISVHENCRQHSETVNCDTAKHSCDAIIRN